jgi:parallel beta-helix repeat protein
VDVDAYASGDGSTDDTAALRQAIATGKHVAFSRGKTYLYSGQLTLKPGQIAYGGGATLKRAAQVKTTTSSSISAGQTTQIDVADASRFVVGTDITVVVSDTTWQQDNRTIVAINGNTLTVNAPFGIDASGATVYTSFHGMSLADGSRVYDLAFDGNRSNWSWYRWQNTKELYLQGARALASGCYLSNLPGEGIYLEADFITVTDCTVQDANGNGIHLGASNRSVIDRARVVNANLDTAVGHADGCIALSNLVSDLTVTGCYLENGISGVASIDSNDNSNVTIVGNTIKSCTASAFEGQAPNNTAPGKVLIANNRIYSSVAVFISGVESSATVFPNRFVFRRNYLENTRLEVRRARNVEVVDNFIEDTGDTQTDEFIVWSSKNVIVRGNTIVGGSSGLYIVDSESLLVEGNYCAGQAQNGIVLWTDDVAGVHVVGNHVLGDAAALSYYRGIAASSKSIIRGNVVQLSQGKAGIYTNSRGIVKDNVVRSTGALYSIRAAPGSTGCLIKDNEATAAFSNGGDNKNLETGTTIVS